MKISAEYFARYNLGHDVDFEPYTNSIVSYTTISNSSRGATRPTWELLYSHYVQIKGLSAPWTTSYLNYSLAGYGGFEPGAGTSGSTSGDFDGLGWGSLLYHRDANDTTLATNTTSPTLPALSTSSTPSATLEASALASTTEGRSASLSASSSSAPHSASTSASAAQTSTNSDTRGTSSMVLYQSKPSAHAHVHGCHARRHHHQRS